MDNIAREIVKTKLKGFKATGFQDAMDRIFLSIYGEEGFQRVKQKKDGGSDGIINGDTIVAAYSPETYSLRDFKRKISSDFDSYGKNWSSTHPKWKVVTNLEATAQMIQHVDYLKSGSPILCIEGLLELISKQTWTIKQSIFKALNIPDMYLANDVVFTVIEDLIQLSEKQNDFQPYEKPAYIEDKVQLNIGNENQAAFMNEYEDCLALFSTIQYVIKGRPQNDIAAIRSKIRSTYSGLTGTFETKLNVLVDTLCKEKVNDDFYRMNMRVVMIYFFEQCLYGVKTKMELSND